MRLAPGFVIGVVVAGLAVAFGVWWLASTWRHPRSGDRPGAGLVLTVGAALLAVSCWPPHIEYHAYIKTTGVVQDARPGAHDGQAGPGWAIHLLSGPALYRCHDPRCGRLRPGDPATLDCERVWPHPRAVDVYRCGWDGAR